MVKHSIPDWQRQKARQMRHAPTAAERCLWQGLRAFNRTDQGHFRRQAPIGPYIVDFADLGRRLIVEVDGGPHGAAADVRRDEWLRMEGFRVLRFRNNDVLGDTGGVLATIEDALETATPHPNPPPEGEGIVPRPATLSHTTRKVGDRKRRGPHRAEPSPPPRGEG